jgi:hypothetical protein
MTFLLLFLVAVCVLSLLADFGPAALRLTMSRLFVLSGVVINLAALQRLGWIAALGLAAGWFIAILLVSSDATNPLGKIFNFAFVLTLLLSVYPVGLSVLFHVAATHALVAVLAASVLLGLSNRWSSALRVPGGGASLSGPTPSVKCPRPFRTSSSRLSDFTSYSDAEAATARARPRGHQRAVIRSYSA